MNIFFHDKNIFRIGVISSDIGNHIKIILPSGETKKVKKHKTTLLLINKIESNFIEQAKKICNTINVKDLWKVAPKFNFTVSDISKKYYSTEVDCKKKAALLMCLVQNPIYFRREEKGAFRTVPDEIVKVAIKRKLIKKLAAEEEKYLINQMIKGILPERINKRGTTLLSQESNKLTEYIAIKKVAAHLGLSLHQVLYKFGILKSAFQLHKITFLNKVKNLEQKKIYLKRSKKNLLTTLNLLSSDVEAYSIDDLTTNEIDDALSLKKIEVKKQNNHSCNWRVGIHIALPAVFLSPDDCEFMGIRDKALSIYTPSEKETMIPNSILKLASLDEDTSKPVLSLYVLFDDEGLVISKETLIEKIFIKKNLRFGEWENEFEKNSISSKLPWEGLRTLYFLSTKLRKNRNFKNYASNLRKEFKVSVISRQEKNLASMSSEGTPKIEVRKRGSIADVVVSEFMILANTVWGEMLHKLSQPTAFRTNKCGITRMQTEVARHDDLGVDYYAWTTSPLRRYIDFINQWQILCSILVDKKLKSFTKEKLDTEIIHFEKKQNLYSNYQKLMERYWVFRWLIEKKMKAKEFWNNNEDSKLIMDCDYIGNGQFSLQQAPLTFKLENDGKSATSKISKVEIESIDCLEMKIKLRPVY